MPRIPSSQQQYHPPPPPHQPQGQHQQSAQAPQPPLPPTSEQQQQQRFYSTPAQSSSSSSSSAHPHAQMPPASSSSSTIPNQSPGQGHGQGQYDPMYPPSSQPGYPRDHPHNMNGWQGRGDAGQAGMEGYHLNGNINNAGPSRGPQSSPYGYTHPHPHSHLPPLPPHHTQGQHPHTHSHMPPPTLRSTSGGAGSGLSPASLPPPPPPLGDGWSSVHPSAASKAMLPPRSGRGGAGGEGGGLASGSAQGQGQSQGQGQGGAPMSVKLEQSGSDPGSEHSLSHRSGPGRPPAPPQAYSLSQSHQLPPIASSSSLSSSSPLGPQSGTGPAAAGTGAGGPGVNALMADPSGGAGMAQTGPSEFIKKLYKMLEEESAMYGKGRPVGQPRGEGAKRGSVGWGRGGSSFVVWDMNDFTTKVLPQTFRHSNFSSFVRQLNKYGFSKIKHVDENTGQIKENVWEFQHPNFQAGGKADLDSIKRKAVAPKKGEEAESGFVARGLAGDEATRFGEMESRIMGLEEQLAMALDELRQARSREMGVLTLAREMIGHMAQVERESIGQPMGELEPSPRIMRLYQVLDQVQHTPATHGHMPQNMYIPPPYMPAASSNPASSSASRPFTNQPFPYMGPGGPSHISPMTDGSGSGSRGGNDGTSPDGSKGSSGRPSAGQIPAGGGVGNGGGASGSGHGGMPRQEQQEDVMDMGRRQHQQQQQTLYNGDIPGMTPVFVDTPAWLTEGTTVPIPMYHRKSSDGATLRLMVEALAQSQSQLQSQSQSHSHSHIQAINTNTGLDQSQDPLDNSPRENTEIKPIIQQSPFGTLIIPPHHDPGTSQSETSNPNPTSRPAVRLSANRRSTTIRPHWTHAPRILVVEDDMVYRQLSSKFLEKFGCEIETVEDAQHAIEKMNRTKYDLVLMDIFFGPSMDGRKATSLIRQFDMYTPIISMTSNAQPKDVDSYLQSGMNDVLAKPFTKHGLFGILDKHLMHLKHIQLSAEVPRSIGLPPLSDQGVADVFAATAAGWTANLNLNVNLGLVGGVGAGVGVGDGDVDGDGNSNNPLAGMGWSDETYQLVLQQFLATGTMPDVSTIGNGTIGTSMIFGDNLMNRKRSIELLDDDWNSPDPPGASSGAGMVSNGTANGSGMSNGAGNGVEANGVAAGAGAGATSANAAAGGESTTRQAKKARK